MITNDRESAAQTRRPAQETTGGEQPDHGEQGRARTLRSLIESPPDGGDRYLEISADPHDPPLLTGAVTWTAADFVGQETGSSGRRPLPAHADIVGGVREHGWEPTMRVLVYPRTPDLAAIAARAWVTLLWAGMSRAVIVTGATPELLGRWATTAPPAAPLRERGEHATHGWPSLVPGLHPTAFRIDSTRVRTRTDIEALLSAPAPDGAPPLLFDARGTGPFHSGGGHIPGALPLAARELYDAVSQPSQGAMTGALPDGYDVDSLSEENPAVLYCGGGVAASLAAAAFEAAGIPWTVYIGSWSEWAKHHPEDEHPPRDEAERNGTVGGSGTQVQR